MILNMSRQGHLYYSFFIIQHSLFIKGVLQLILQHALFYIFSAQAAQAAPIRQAFPSQTARAVRRLVPPASKTAHTAPLRDSDLRTQIRRQHGDLPPACQALIHLPRKSLKTSPPVTRFPHDTPTFPSCQRICPQLCCINVGSSAAPQNEIRPRSGPLSVCLRCAKTGKNQDVCRILQKTSQRSAYAYSKGARRIA